MMAEVLVPAALSLLAVAIVAMALGAHFEAGSDFTATNDTDGASGDGGGDGGGD
jgi:hypothetical protein